MASHIRRVTLPPIPRELIVWTEVAKLGLPSWGGPDGTKTWAGSGAGYGKIAGSDKSRSGEDDHAKGGQFQGRLP